MSTTTRARKRSHYPSAVLDRLAQRLRDQAQIDALAGRAASAERCRRLAEAYEDELAARGHRPDSLRLAEPTSVLVPAVDLPWDAPLRAGEL